MNKKSGQVTVLIMLLSLMGLTVGLSQASRSLSDLNQVSFVDTGTRAFAAAEMGLNIGLNQLSAGTTLNCGSPTTVSASDGYTIPAGISSITYETCPNSASASALFTNVVSDEAVEIDLSKINSTTSGVDILWSNKQAGLEVMVLDGNNYLIRKAYTGVGNLPSSGLTSFLNSSDGLNCKSPYCFSEGTFDSGQCTTADNTGMLSIAVSSGYKTLRIKPLIGANTSMNIGVCGKTILSGIPSLGSTSYLITAVAKTTNGTQKKVQAIKTPPALAGVFDNAIYSTGKIFKY